MGADESSRGCVPLEHEVPKTQEEIDRVLPPTDREPWKDKSRPITVITSAEELPQTDYKPWLKTYGEDYVPPSRFADPDTTRPGYWDGVPLPLPKFVPKKKESAISE